MEGVGARLGRSSTRYGPTTVFTGPVRRWKKRWVGVAPSPNTGANSNHGGGRFRANVNADDGNDAASAAVAGTTSSTGNHTSSHLFLYKWTPLTQSNNSNKEDNAAADKDDTPEEERPRRKCKYIPVALLELQKTEDGEEKKDDEVKPIEGEEIAEDPVSTPNGVDDKPDVTPKDESQDDGQQVVRQDLNESTLDLNSHELDSDSKPEEAL